MAIAAIHGENRRGKTCLFLSGCFVAALNPRLIHFFQNFFPAIILSLLLGGYGLKIVLNDLNQSEFDLDLIKTKPLEDFPFVDVLVSLRDEENVVQRLVERLSAIQ